MATLEFVRTYLDDPLCFIRGSLDDHLKKLKKILTKLQEASLKINANKSKLCAYETKHLGYLPTRYGIKPQAKKVQVIFALKLPSNVKELHQFLGLVQDYQDLWAKCSKMLDPLNDLVGKCGQQTKVT